MGPEVSCSAKFFHVTDIRKSSRLLSYVIKIETMSAWKRAMPKFTNQYNANLREYRK